MLSERCKKNLKTCLIENSPYHMGWSAKDFYNQYHIYKQNIKRFFMFVVTSKFRFRANNTFCSCKNENIDPFARDLSFITSREYTWGQTLFVHQSLRGNYIIMLGFRCRKYCSTMHRLQKIVTVKQSV